MFEKLRAGVTGIMGKAKVDHGTGPNIREPMLDEINHSPISLSRISQHSGIKKMYLSLPHDCYVRYDFEHSGMNGALVSKVEYIAVPNLLQRGGIGTRLLQALATDAKANGVETIRAELVNEEGFRMWMKAFGGERVITDYEFMHSGVPLSTLRDEQIRRINSVHRLKIHVNLAGIDTTGWEEPILQDPRFTS